MWEGCPCKFQRMWADDMIRHPNRIIRAWLQGEDIDDNDVVAFGAPGETITASPVLRPPTSDPSTRSRKGKERAVLVTSLASHPAKIDHMIGIYSMGPNKSNYVVLVLIAVKVK